MNSVSRRGILTGGLGVAVGAVSAGGWKLIGPGRGSVTPFAYNAGDFGAVGDGVTDDTAALQAALNAAAGDTLVLDPGIYLISGVLTVSQGTTVSGRGATIRRKTGYNLEMLGNWVPGDTTTTGYSGNSDIFIEGITFDGNAATQAGNMVAFVHCQNIVIRDCIFLDCTANHHLELNSTRHAEVSNCQFLGFRPLSTISVRKEAIQIDRAHPSLGVGGARDGTMSGDITIESCYFGPDNKGNRAPNIAVGTHQEAPEGNYYDNVRVLNCVGKDLNHAGTRWVNTRGLRVVGNEFTLARRPVPVGQGESGVMLYGFACTVSTDVLVAENRFVVASGEHAISVDIRKNSDWAQVIGNMLRYGKYALFIENSNDCNFRDNYCLSHTIEGVHLRSTRRAHISTNTFYNAGANGGNIAQVEGSGTNGQAIWNNIDSNVAQYVGSGNTPPTVGVTCNTGTSQGTSVRMNRFRQVPTIHQGPSSDVVAYNTSN